MNDAELIGLLLREQWPDCRINRVQTEAALVEALHVIKFDLILSDFTLPQFDGMSALALTREYDPATPFIFISGTIGEDNAVEALRRGATDYVIKDRPARLIPAIHRALKEAMEQRWRQHAENQLRENFELLNKARDAIVVSNLAHRITYWNQGAERLFGWSADEVIGLREAELFGASAVSEIPTARLALAAGDEWCGEVHVLSKDGQPRVVESRVTVIRDEAGRHKSQLIISTDLAAQRNPLPELTQD